MIRAMATKQSVMFFNHGNLTRDAAQSGHLTTEILNRRNRTGEEKMIETLEKGQVKDIPSWCKLTTTWQDHVADNNIVELVREKPAPVLAQGKVEVPTEAEDGEGFAPPARAKAKPDNPVEKPTRATRATRASGN